MFPRAPDGSNGWLRTGSSRGLRSAPEYDPCRTARRTARRAEQHARRRAHSPGVSSPSAFEVAGSDRRRVCLARLCCVFRLSQPLDALFRPKPCRSCFIPATLVGFALQRFVPSGRRSTSRRSLPLLTSLSTGARGVRPSPVRAAPPRPPVGSGEPAWRVPRKCAVGIERAFRGFSSTRKSVLRSTVVGRTNGADPLVGVFNPPGCSPVLP